MKLWFCSVLLEILAVATTVIGLVEIERIQQSEIYQECKNFKFFWPFHKFLLKSTPDSNSAAFVGCFVILLC